jgi:hypothetical protein
MAKRKAVSRSGRTDLVKMSIRLEPKWAAFIKHCAIDDSIALKREFELGEVVERALPLLKRQREEKAGKAPLPGTDLPPSTSDPVAAPAEIPANDLDSAA